MIAFTEATLIDGTGSAPVASSTVLVEGTSIAAAGTAIEVPEGATVINLAGKTLMPGLIDAHAHMGGSPELDARAGNHGRVGTWDYACNSNRFLEYGITAVRSGGDWFPDILEFRDEVERGGVRAPHIVASGRFVQAFEGHPAYTVYGGDPEVIKNACVMIHKGDGRKRIRDVVKRLVNEGVDVVKIFCGDDDKTVFPRDMTVPSLADEQIEAVCDEAHKAGKLVMCHVDDVADMERAVAGGVDTVEHTVNVCTDPNQTLSQDLIDLIIERGVWATPTLVATRVHEDFDFVNGAPSVMGAARAAVGRMIEAGVKIGVGTDAGIPFQEYGLSLHQELEELVRCGMTPLEALCAATGGNAELLQRSDRYGTVETGKCADLLVLTADPLADIGNSRAIGMVLRDGEIVVDHLLSA